MGGAIFFDVILWIAAIVLFILAAITPSFVYLISGLICLVLAIVLLCILVGGNASSGFSLLDDFDI
jgi:membrane-bound ClpP family serine protease